jgi:hypothetical protein
VKYTMKGRSSIVVSVIALLVVGFSLVSSLARRIGVVEPRVRIERGRGENAAQTAALIRAQAVRQVIDGEVFTTAERLREVCSVASVGGLLAATERRATSSELLRELSNRLPPGVTQTDQANVFASPTSSIIVRFQSAPIGVEVASVAKDKRSGPALIARVGAGNGAKVWSSIGLDEIHLPRPFAEEAEVLAAGWRAETVEANR